MLIGVGKEDTVGPELGYEVDVKAGDVIVLPAGVGHCNLKSKGDFKYIAVYPKVFVQFIGFWSIVCLVGEAEIFQGRS